MEVMRRIGDTLKSKRVRKPIVSVVLSTVISYSLTLVVITTDHWEKTDFHDLDTLPNLARNDSIIDDQNGFYSLKLVRRKLSPAVSNSQTFWPAILKQTWIDAADNTTQDNVTISTTTQSSKIRIFHVLLRSRSGGIWQICDRISEELRTSKHFNEITKTAPSFRMTCYNYIKDYEKANMTEKGIAIIRMQNSAVSCVIVCILCMASSLCTGAFGIWKEQVAVCMVTGVLNCVSGTFLCFALTIMATKFRYMTGDCLTIDTTLPPEVCQVTYIHMSWSMALGWLSLVVVVFNAVVWLYLSRCYRLEKSKSIV